MGVYKRGKRWHIRFRVNGKEIRETADTEDRQIALAKERELRKRYANEEMYEARNETFDTLVERYTKEYAPSLKPGSRLTYKYYTTTLMDFFGGMRVQDIQRRTVANFVQDRRSEGDVTDATIRSYLVALSSMLACAVEWGWVEFNAVKMLNKRFLQMSAPRTRYLSHAEEAAFLKACDDSVIPNFADMVAFAIDTGIRKMEQLNLTVGQISTERSEIVLYDTKNRQPRVVPLLPRSAQIAAQLSAGKNATDYLFSAKRGGHVYDTGRPFQAAAKASGIQEAVWHDLRRTCGCRLLQDYKLDLHKVSKWLGHKSINITERNYAFLAVNDLHEAVRNGPGIGHNSGHNVSSS